MTIACAPPDDIAGVALRVSVYLDCHGRALGENGFQAVAGGIAGGLLTGLITIFVALIGYRLILGHVPGVRDGVTWMVRLGLVLTLATSWSAFQTLIYRVAVDGPDELAQVVLPAAGLPMGEVAGRIQAAYDALRLGTEIAPSNGDTQVSSADAGTGTSTAPATPITSLQSRARTAQPPLPQTASLLVVFTLGIAGALRVAIGLLLALGPLIVMGLLFDATLDLVAGWLRALVGAAFALLAAMVVTMLELAVLEGELARLQALGGTLDPSTFDPQALTTIVLLFGLVMIAATAFAARVASAIRLTAGAGFVPSLPDHPIAPLTFGAPPSLSAAEARTTEPATGRPPRAASVADAVVGMARRNRDYDDPAGVGDVWAAPPRISPLATARQDEVRPIVPLGIVGRRAQPRRSRTVTLRDGAR